VISYCFAGGNLENTTNLLVITQLYTAWFIDCSKFPSRLRDDAISNQMHSQHKQQHRTWITWILDSPAWWREVREELMCWIEGAESVGKPLAVWPSW
jgi:hypothetical protein